MGISTTRSKLKRGLTLTQKESGDLWEYIRSLEKQEPKTGHWIDIDAETYTWKIRCDKCGHERSMMSTQGHYPKFCEECGAKMESEVEE